MTTPDTDTQHHRLPDFLPSSGINDSSNRRVVAGGLLVLIALIGITSYVAFRSVPGPFHGGSTTATAPAAAAPAVVTITKSGFVPATISIKVGQAVAWTNTDSEPHFVTSNDPKPLDSTAPDPASQQPLNRYDSFSYVFSKAGSYGYHDNDSGLTGTVIVK
jgi:plastocyanin